MSTSAAFPKRLPTLLISGTRDRVGENGQGVRRLLGMYQAAGLECVCMKLYEDARHELANETIRDEVTADVIAWLDDTVRKTNLRARDETRPSRCELDSDFALVVTAFDAAFDHSAVNYTGYGDVVISAPWQLMGPLAAADGVLMFGVTTAMIFPVIQRLIRLRVPELRN